ncbi:hypothetical protein WME90_02010 [Sorangium sp. So ce375]|uniref:hypothetical protein n=1 Tax=Sorangium sp. So ce375 TaxID=3133306 RepID=UPI003F5AF34D
MRAVVGGLVMVAGCALPGGADEHLPWSPAPSPTVDVATVSSSSSSGSTSSAASSSATGAGGDGGGAGGQGGAGGDAATTATASSSSAGGEGGQGGGPAPECLSAKDCRGQDGPCAWRTCDDGVCGRALAPEGTPLEEQTPGDCLEQRCDGRGGQQAVPAPVDVADDGKDCTADACGPKGPTHDAVATGTPCSEGLCQGGACVDYIPVRCKVPDPEVDFRVYVDCEGVGWNSWIRWQRPDGTFDGCVSHGPGYCAPGWPCRVHRDDGAVVAGTCL